MQTVNLSAFDAADKAMVETISRFVSDDTGNRAILAAEQSALTKTADQSKLTLYYDQALNINATRLSRRIRHATGYWCEISVGRHHSGGALRIEVEVDVTRTRPSICVLWRTYRMYLLVAALAVLAVAWWALQFSQMIYEPCWQEQTQCARRVVRSHTICPWFICPRIGLAHVDLIKSAVGKAAAYLLD